MSSAIGRLNARFGSGRPCASGNASAGSLCDVLAIDSRFASHNCIWVNERRKVSQPARARRPCFYAVCEHDFPYGHPPFDRLQPSPSHLSLRQFQEHVEAFRFRAKDRFALARCQCPRSQYLRAARVANNQPPPAIVSHFETKMLPAGTACLRPKAAFAAP